MARAIRSAVTFLGFSAAAGIILAGCSGSSNGDATNYTTGGMVGNFGGQVGTGGSKANTGGAATGGAATGGAATGGAATGGAATGAATGGAATGGAAPTGGKTATGGTKATGGSVATGGTSPTGGSSSTGAACADYTGATPTTFCTVTESAISLNGICASGCSAGGVTMTGSASGLAITGTIYSVDPVFNGNPLPNNIAGGTCAGFSAKNPDNGENYTSMSIGITNNMDTAQVVNVILTDLASGTSPTSYTLTASVTIPAGESVTRSLKWGNSTSNCNGATGCTNFVPSCALGTDTAFEPTQLLKLGLGVGNSSTTYPISNVDIVITSISFT